MKSIETLLNKTRLILLLAPAIAAISTITVQALSRSFYARIIPADKSAEYFGFYNMLGKFAVVMGPAFMGGIGLLVRSMGYSSNIASRAGISSIALFFMAGGILLYFVDERKGKEEVRYLENDGSRDLP